MLLPGYPSAIRTVLSRHEWVNELQTSSLADASIRDLGAIEGPVLIFGGPYSNLEATRALLAEADRLRIDTRNMICTGDAVAYGADPEATVAIMRRRGIATVLGNVEEQLGAEAADCGCGFAPGTTCERLSAAWYGYGAGRLDRDAKAWMAALPRMIRFTLGGRRFAVVHGAPSRINRFVFASAADHDLAAEIALSGAEAVIGGHCGLPFTRSIGDKLWHNAGVIGMPANDGTPRTWFSTLALEGARIRLTRRPLAYDHGRAAEKMREAGLPAEYSQALGSGLWDNDEILPPPERAAKGHPLAPLSTTWPSAMAPGPRAAAEASIA